MRLSTLAAAHSLLMFLLASTAALEMCARARAAAGTARMRESLRRAVGSAAPCRGPMGLAIWRRRRGDMSGSWAKGVCEVHATVSQDQGRIVPL